MELRNENAIFWRWNGKRQKMYYHDFDYRIIKSEWLKMCSSLILVVNESYGDFENIAFYRFTTEELRTDFFLRALLFGRSGSYGQIAFTQTQYDTLYKAYKRCIIAKCNINELYAFDSNLGIASEKYLCSHGFKHGTEKQDKNQCIDVIDNNNKRAQVKESISTEKTKGKGATANCRRKKR